MVGFDGAVQLKENEPITRDIIKEGQENYFYFDTEPGIAYEVYTDSAMDTQATMYDESKERVGYADDTGTNKNFSFVGSYNKRRYIKVSAKNKATKFRKKLFCMDGTGGHWRCAAVWRKASVRRRQSRNGPAP